MSKIKISTFTFKRLETFSKDMFETAEAADGLVEITLAEGVEERLAKIPGVTWDSKLNTLMNSEQE